MEAWAAFEILGVVFLVSWLVTLIPTRVLIFASEIFWATVVAVFVICSAAGIVLYGHWPDLTALTGPNY